VVVRDVDRIDLGGNAKRPTGASSDIDREIWSLLLGDPSDEGEVFASPAALPLVVAEIEAVGYGRHPIDRQSVDSFPLMVADRRQRNAGVHGQDPLDDRGVQPAVQRQHRGRHARFDERKSRQVDVGVDDIEVGRVPVHVGQHPQVQVAADISHLGGVHAHPQRGADHRLQPGAGLRSAGGEERHIVTSVN
jgi:hypothetical protein